MGPRPQLLGVVFAATEGAQKPARMSPHGCPGDKTAQGLSDAGMGWSTVHKVRSVFTGTATDHKAWPEMGYICRLLSADSELDNHFNGSLTGKVLPVYSP